MYRARLEDLWPQDEGAAVRARPEDRPTTIAATCGLIDRCCVSTYRRPTLTGGLPEARPAIRSLLQHPRPHACL